MRTLFGIAATALTLSAPVFAASDLVGSWAAPCAKESGSSSTTVMDYTETTSKWSYTSYSDGSCKASLIVEDIDFTYVAKGPSSRNPAIDNLDLTISKVALTPIDARVVSYLNNQKYCGVSTWKLNVASDITGAKCGDNQMPSAGAAFYHAYKINGGSLQMGAFTDSEDGSSEEKRPAALDTSVTYTKQ